MKDGPESTLAMLGAGELEQTVLVQVAEGAAQDAGEAEVVVGIEGEAGHGDQVVEGDVR